LLLLAALLPVGLLPAQVNPARLDFERLTPVAADEPVPIQDFFRPPRFGKPALNPAGTAIAAEGDTGSGQLALLVGDLGQPTLRPVRFYKDEDVEWFSWLDDSRILTSLVGEKRFPRALYVTHAATLRTYPIARYSATALIGVPTREPLHPLLWVYHNATDSGRDLGVIQVDAEKRLGEYEHPIPGSFQESVARDEEKLHGTRAQAIGSFPTPPGGGLVVNYLSDQDGELAFAITASEAGYALFRYAGEKWLPCPVNLDQYQPLTAGDRSGELVVLGPREEGRPRPLLRLDAATGAPGERLLQDDAYDVTSATFLRHPVSRKIIGLKYHRAQPHTEWFDEKYAQLQRTLAARFPGQVANLIGGNPAGNRFVFSVSSDRQPPVYHWYDTDTETVGLIAASAPWIDAARMRPTRVLRIETRDGAHLEAYLTLPAGGATEARPPPVVVLVHGGPQLRDSWGFNGEVQFLASRGYAVLQVNYRGSAGYHWMFPPADLWDFRKMHQDVTDAAHMLGRSGLVDPDRMAIMGTSFGGYLALCGAAFEPGRYRCAISIAGVFDWARTLAQKKSDQYENPAYAGFLRALGDPRSNRQQLDAISPLHRVDQIKVPIFVAHGRDDAVADYRESRALLAALEKNHVPHESLIVPGEGHGMSFTKNQVELYSRIEAFLARYLAPAK